ncbi:MAG: carbohydrate porin [Verrucomicrobiota bacterium]
MKKHRLQSIGLALSLAFLGAAVNGQAGQTARVESTDNSSYLGEWWNGKYATGNWFGVRDTLENHGVKLGVEWKANFFWNVDGGLQQRFGYDDEWKFRTTLDMAKLTGWDAIEGLTLFSDVRYRGGSGVNKYIGSSNEFSPSTFQTGQLWRFQNAYATYTTPQLFGVKEFLTISGGWQNPTDVFINQPLNKFFLNNTLTSKRGIGSNGIGWGGSYAAWGGYLKVKPLEWFYLQSGLYLAIPDAGSASNHGLFFAGAQPPDRNGLFWLTETGVTPKIGPSKLPGRYAAGLIYWGLENTSYYGAKYDQKLLFYWQADQQLYREPSPEEPAPPGKGSSDGKTFKDTVKTSKPSLNKQGLYFFSLINFAPEYDNPVSFYLQTGLVYKGLIPTRDADQFGIAFVYGDYSDSKELADERNGLPIQTYEGVIEFSYRVQLNKWAYVQPDLQYIIRPKGTGLTQNATVLGFQLGVTF